MFELPEFLTLAKQINESLCGKVIQRGSLGNSPHKFVWYNRSQEEFEALTSGKRVWKAWAKGKWLFIPLEPGYLLLLGECGGRVLYHLPGAKWPDKYHLLLTFTDGSAFTATTQMWGAMELFERGAEVNRQYIKGMRPTPIDPKFTPEYFITLVDSLAKGEKRSVKSLLTQDQLIPGLGNAIAQDILFKAHLHPRHPVETLKSDQKEALFAAIQETVQEVIAGGGRDDEVDLHNQPGKYIRRMDKRMVGKPCPDCGTAIEKIQYLGGACYICPSCQE